MRRQQPTDMPMASEVELETTCDTVGKWLVLELEPRRETALGATLGGILGVILGGISRGDPRGEP